MKTRTKLIIKANLNNEQQTIEFVGADLKNTVKSLKTKIIEKLNNILNIQNKLNKYNLRVMDVQLYIKGISLIPEDKQLIEFPIFQNESQIQCLVVYNKLEDIQIDSIKVPTLTKEGYKTSPDISILRKMTQNELKMVKNFKIYNEYGSIEFMDPVDLNGVNLDTFCEIEKNSLTIEDNLILENKQLSGTKLCTIAKCLNIHGNEGGIFNLTQKDVQRAKETIESFNGTFMYFNKENGDLVFKYTNQL